MRATGHPLDTVQGMSEYVNRVREPDEWFSPSEHARVFVVDLQAAYDSVREARGLPLRLLPAYVRRVLLLDYAADRQERIRARGRGEAGEYVENLARARTAAFRDASAIITSGVSDD